MQHLSTVGIFGLQPGEDVKINADYNASLVIKKRGIQDLVNGGVVVKESRQVMRLKKHAKVGREQAKFTRGETTVRRSGDPTPRTTTADDPRNLSYNCISGLAADSSSSRM